MKANRFARLLGASLLAAQLAASSGVALLPAQAQSPRICVVAPSGAEFTRIQAAIDTVGCDIINIASGNIYREPLRVNRAVIIQGLNTDRRLTVIDGNNAFRTLEVLRQGTLTLRNVTLQNGLGAYPGDAFASPRGGGLLNDGFALLENVGFKGHRNGLPGDGFGEAIDNDGTLQMEAIDLEGQGGCLISSRKNLSINRSTLRSNGRGRGLCALNLFPGEWIVTNSTIWGMDLAIDANFTGSGGIATFIGNTFGNNNAIISHSGTTPSTFAAQFGNNILQKSASSTKPNCTTAIAGWTPVNFGNNLDSDGTCGFGPATNALLDPDGLQPWLSRQTNPPIDSVFVQFGSPARRAGEATLCNRGTDQLGTSRPPECTVGAVQETFWGLFDIIVWEDTNRNGTRDSGEPYVANWPVRMIYVGQGRPGEISGVTNAFGSFATSLTTVGRFDICIAQQTGWAIASAGAVAKAGLWCYESRNLGRNSLGAFALGIYRTSTGATPTPTPTAPPAGVTIRVRNTDPAGAPIAGLTARVDVYANGTAPTQVSDSAGNATFSGLAAGNFRICVIKPANRTIIRPTNTDGSGNPCYWYTLNSGADVSVPFDWSAISGGPTSTPRPPTATPQPAPTSTPVPGGASFIANVFNDANGNGSRDAGEAALSGWRVTAFDQANNDAIARAGTSDASGNVTLSGLASGSYRICEDLQSGWVNTRPTARDGAGRPCYWFSIQSGQSQPLPFGNRNSGTPATVTPVATATPNSSGVVRFNIISFYDSNQNGIFDLPAENYYGVQFFTITNTLTGASVFAMTDEVGRWSREVPGPGNYKICEADPYARSRITRPVTLDEFGRACYWLTMPANSQVDLTFGFVNRSATVAASALVPPIELKVQPLEPSAALRNAVFLPMLAR
jgi:hypothetical protein